MRTPSAFIGTAKCITSFFSRTTAEVTSRLPAGTPLQNALRAVMRKPPSAGTASPELSSQSPPPVEMSTTLSFATFSSIGCTGAFWFLQRHAASATMCVCIEKASAVLGQARAMVFEHLRQLGDLHAFAAQLGRHRRGEHARGAQLVVVLGDEIVAVRHLRRALAEAARSFLQPVLLRSCHPPLDCCLPAAEPRPAC